jgi:phenylpropionate dioxygenase-like ring-hydroxylating dioxygenase large terminal subunit
MLTRQDNEILTRVGPGTPMGELMRQYWQPVLFSSELPERDGPPLRVRHLSEDLVAFRDTDGRVGLVAENCPHRGASLFFGRNEEAGLRCVYHGWKFDATGACIDMPNEPSESNFKHKVRVTAYPCVERGGIIWTYMGRAGEPPSLPDLEWNLVPDSHVYLSKRVAQNNFMQALEGEIDSSHSGFLHSLIEEEANYDTMSLHRRPNPTPDSKGMYYKMKDRHPHFETLHTDYGVMIGARRKAEEDSWYWRITQFLMPFYTLIPPYGQDPSFSGHAWMPMDDHHVVCLCFTYHPTKPLTERHLENLRHGREGLQGLHPTVDAFLPVSSRPAGAWWPKINRDNDFMQDWDRQKSVAYSGLPGTWPQDSGCQETMGPIYDRTRERLGTSDTGIIQVRRRLIQAAKELRDTGDEPREPRNPAFYAIRSAAVVLPRKEHWVEAAAEYLKATPGVNFAAA